MFTRALVNCSTAKPFRFSRNRFLCFFCLANFNESSDLLDHIQCEHKDYKLDDNGARDLTKYFWDNATLKVDITDMACKLCHANLCDVSDFIDHLFKKHSLKFNKDLSKYVFQFKLTNSEELSCLHCTEKFKYFGQLARHMNHCHNQLAQCLCEMCGKGFATQKAVEKHVQLKHSNAEEFPCNRCDEIFPSLAKLATHAEKVHRSHKFRCWECAENFPSRYVKKRHLAIVHDAKNFRFPCSECDTLFFEKNRLLNHQLKVHLKKKNVSCDICGFKAYNAAFLRRHLISHSDERPFECEYCKKTFQRRTTLTTHMKIHYRDKDKKHLCVECGRAFAQIASLKAHCKTNHSTLSEKL